MLSYLADLIISLLMILVGVYWLYRYYNAKKYWIETTGTLIGFEKNNDSAVPIIRYYDQEYNEIAAKASSSHWGSENDIVTIYYNPDKKTSFVIKGGVELFAPYIFLVGGTVFLIYSVNVLILT